MENIQNQDNPSILLTGGHGATTGMAVIEAIKNRIPNAHISWIGSVSAISGSSVTSLEYKIYPSLGVKYYSIKAGKLQTKFTRYTIPLLLQIPVGFFQSFGLFLKIKPKVILSFGGYSSFPIVFWGWFFRVPIVLHEQTIAAGRASILSAFFANKIALSRIESLKYFPKKKCIVTGNPVRKEILLVKPKTSFGKSKTILIMGGSRGSEFINEEIVQVKSDLLKKYKVIHITGERDYEKYKNLNSEDYQVLKFVNPKNMPDLYNKSDLIISRSGANSISEILIIKRPAILIPLPRTFMDEQYKNAKYAEDFGLGKVMLETEVNSETLLNAIENIFSNWQKIVRKVINKEVIDATASSKVVDLVLEFL